MLLRLLLPIWSIAVLLLSAMGPAQALDAIAISPDQERIEITTLGQLYEGRGDSLQVETAASADGTTGRMAVRATTPGTNPSWLVLALTNTSEIPVERWLTADRYTIIGSGIVWLPAAIWLMASGDVGKGVILVVFGTVVEGLDVVQRLVVTEPIAKVSIEGDPSALLATYATQLAEWNRLLDERPIETPIETPATP